MCCRCILDATYKSIYCVLLWKYIAPKVESPTLTAYTYTYNTVVGKRVLLLLYMYIHLSFCHASQAGNGLEKFVFNVSW